MSFGAKLAIFCVSCHIGDDIFEKNPKNQVSDRSGGRLYFSPLSESTI